MEGSHHDPATVAYNISRDYYEKKAIKVVERSGSDCDVLISFVPPIESRAARAKAFNSVFCLLPSLQQQHLCQVLNHNPHILLKYKFALLFALGEPIDTLFRLYIDFGSRTPIYSASPDHEFWFRADAVAMVLDEIDFDDSDESETEEEEDDADEVDTEEEKDDADESETEEEEQEELMAGEEEMGQPAPKPESTFVSAAGRDEKDDVLWQIKEDSSSEAYDIIVDPNFQPANGRKADNDSGHDDNDREPAPVPDKAAASHQSASGSNDNRNAPSTNSPKRKRVPSKDLFPDDLPKYELGGKVHFETEQARAEVRSHLAALFQGSESNGLSLLKGTKSQRIRKWQKRQRWHCAHQNDGLCPWTVEEVEQYSENFQAFHYAYFRVGTAPHEGHYKTCAARL